MRKCIKQISDQPPVNLRVGGSGASSGKTPAQKDSSLFRELTLRHLSDEDKDKLRAKAAKLVRRMRAKDPEAKRQNELLLRQVIAYLALEFGKDPSFIMNKVRECTKLKMFNVGVLVTMMERKKRRKNRIFGN